MLIHGVFPNYKKFYSGILMTNVIRLILICTFLTGFYSWVVILSTIFDLVLVPNICDLLKKIENFKGTEELRNELIEEVILYSEFLSKSVKVYK